MAVIPKKVISQTIYDPSIQGQSISYLGEPNSEEVSEAYQSWLLNQRAKKLVGTIGGQCVIFVRNFTGATPEDVGGMARTVAINSQIPGIGFIIKTDESNAGHLGVIIGINGDELTVVDSNYGWDGIIRIRKINIQDSKILGYKRL